MLGIKSAISHAGNWPAIAYAFSFIAYCLGSKDRWHRFLVLLVVVVLVVVMLVLACWLLADGNMLRHCQASRHRCQGAP